MYQRSKVFWSCVFSCLITWSILRMINSPATVHEESLRVSTENAEIRIDETKYHQTEDYSFPEDDMNRPLIFIGGMPRSGTTLMRTMMDAHPDIRCGQETHVIPEMLSNKLLWTSTDQRVKRLDDAGVVKEVLDKAVAKFIWEIIKGHGPEAKILCDKDPYNLMSAEYLYSQFPNAKFVLMIRDGRAITHSIVSRQVTIFGLDVSSYRAVITKWNKEIFTMYNQCLKLGKDVCHAQSYEQLVLQPVNQTKVLFEFLNIPWCETVLHHDEHLNNTKLSSFEVSTDQVKKPLYLDALSSWFGHIPPDVERDLAKIAPMLSVLGYDPYNPTPTYGEPDEFVLKKIQEESKKR